MDVTLPARGVRIGGVTVAPGEARAVAIALAPRPSPGKRGAARAVPAWVVVGAKPGPRISIVAAARGTESGAAAAARAVASALDPTTLVGSVVVVPVLRVGGRFAPRRQPGAAWRFPGEAGGSARARDAFTLFSELAVGAGALLALGAPRGGRRAALVARGDLHDPRVRRLAVQSGALVTRSRARGALGDLTGAAGAAGVVALELSAAESPGDEARAVESLRAGVTAALRALGALPPESHETHAPRPPPSRRPEALATAGPAVRLRAPAGGLVTAAVAAGAVVRAGALLAEIAPTLPGRPTRVTAPHDALVVEAPGRAAARKGTVLFVLAPLAPGARPRRGPAAPHDEPPPPGAAKLRAGWIEHVTLPDLAIPRLKAKLDTGARTSALHVSRMRTVDTTAGPLHRPILEITVPGGGRGRKPHRVRAAVRGYVVVRDSSGRTERRPVIETALHLGPLRKRIAVTLTNRGDMLYPMLIGRTALGATVVVDPARRFLLKN